MHQIARPSARANFPKQTRIISKSALNRAWKKSRDASSSPGRPGVDQVTAQQFSYKLDRGISTITQDFRMGTFGFSNLKAVFIPKPGSEKERLICIPTVRDRLVQRVIAQYINVKRIFPIYHSSSFGFREGIGVSDAINAVVLLRSEYEWCLKTDIESFFDRIPRDYLKKRVSYCLKNSSLVPVLHKVIDCEAKITNENRKKFEKQGIRRGCGIRQGMPLSPLLANLALSEFDLEIERLGIRMIRYADDLVLFFKSKDEALTGKQAVVSVLEKVQLTIPEISSTSKTKLVSPRDPLFFLGREILYLGSKNSYVARISIGQIKKIKEKLSNEYCFTNRIAKQSNFQETVVDLSKSVAAYLGIYKDAENFDEFHAELRGHARKIMSAIFIEIFGAPSLSKVSVEGKKFLGLDILDAVIPNPELNV